MNGPDPRTPVLVGVGTASGDAEADELMAEALLGAVEDGGAPALLGRIDRICVPKGTWNFPDPARLVAQRLGVTGATTWLGALGVSQQTIITESLRAITAGSCDVVAVVGGEARARQLRLARQLGGQVPELERRPGAGLAGPLSTEADAPDFVLDREPDFFDPAEVAAGLVLPVAQYAMIEHALAHAESTSDEQHRADIAGLWARFNAVAATNPEAAFPQPMTAGEIATALSTNRPLADPYHKWHASQWNVNQAAALLLCSVETARDLGIPVDRWVFPLVGLAAGAPLSLSCRRELHRWPAMAVLGQAAALRIGRPLAEVEVLELYSCFPAAVRVQQRELGLPLGGTPTVTGGMTFAGGPFNNFVYQATAAVIRLLRERPGAMGAVTTICGLLTSPGLAVWSTEPDGRSPLLADLGEAARAATPTAEVVPGHRGPATVATFTVTPDRTFVIADLEDRRRCVAASEDPEVATEALEAGLIGRRVRVEEAVFSLEGDGAR